MYILHIVPQEFILGLALYAGVEGEKNLCGIHFDTIQVIHLT